MVVAAPAAAGEGFRARPRMPVSNGAGLPYARWQKTMLRELARWRWATRVYARPLELAAARRHIALRQPQIDGL